MTGNLVKTTLTSILLILASYCQGHGFNLIKSGRPAAIYYNGESEVVRTALQMYISDAQLVCDTKPRLTTTINGNSVVVASLSEKSDIEPVLKEYGITTTDIAGKWEAFKIIACHKGVQNHLFVIGSDPRGTAYGILELSRIIGVSPWVWWADAVPQKSYNIELAQNYTTTQQPSVQYRGIFINDEDWGLVPWSANYEGLDNKGAVGPKTYSRIFELLLRLRANTIWPAMHRCTTPFYFVEGNKEVADRYGIVVGTSHCEPMMRNNEGEWDRTDSNGYNFVANRQGVLSYWEKRLNEVAQSEVFYTLGMRGVHDDKMEGAETLDEQTALTNVVIDYQRKLLAKHINPDLNKIPQAIVPYKEVLKIYENGMKIPDDVTLTWCDDNYGYITRLSTEAERKRSGGSGVYYHTSYWGKPHDYLWLTTTQPSLIYNEMRKAWNYDARKIWILNVGDIKPAEYHTELFMDMAWNIDAITPSTIYDHQRKWLAREFGSSSATKIFDIIKEHYLLSSLRKPEHMGWSRVQHPGAKGGFTPIANSRYSIFDNHLANRLKSYDSIERASEALYASLPASKRDTYFQLVHYPVCGAAQMNRKLLYGQYAREFAKLNIASANVCAKLSEEAFEKITELTWHYNIGISNGKWYGMMDPQPRRLNVYKPLEFNMPKNMSSAQMLYLQGDSSALKADKMATCPTLVSDLGSNFNINLFNVTPTTTYSIENAPSWLIIKASKGIFNKHLTLTLGIEKGSVSKSAKTTATLKVNGINYPLELSAIGTIAGLPEGCKVENNGIIAFNAADHNGNGAIGSSIVQGLGHSQKGVALRRSKADKSSKSYLEYDIYLHNDGEVIIGGCFVPSHPVVGGELRYAISVDDTAFQMASVSTEPFESEQWKINVLRNQARGTTTHNLAAGAHKIKLYALDNDMVADQIFVLRIDKKEPYELPVN